jgi:hypothetical protein
MPGNVPPQGKLGYPEAQKNRKRTVSQFSSTVSQLSPIGGQFVPAIGVQFRLETKGTKRRTIQFNCPPIDPSCERNELSHSYAATVTQLRRNCHTVTGCAHLLVEASPSAISHTLMNLRILATCGTRCGSGCGTRGPFNHAASRGGCSCSCFQVRQPFLRIISRISLLLRSSRS